MLGQQIREICGQHVGVDSQQWEPMWGRSPVAVWSHPATCQATQRGGSSPTVPQPMCLDGLRQVLLGVLLHWGRVCRDPSVLQDRSSPLGMGTAWWQLG